LQGRDVFKAAITGILGLLIHIGIAPQALCDIDWLADHPEGVRIIKFEEHNGQSAKRRSSDAQRKANVRNVSAQGADNERTESGRVVELEKEKRREEKKEPKSKAESATATRLPAGWMPSYDDARFCASERKDLSIDTTASRFRDYWIAQPGAKGRKLDWSATWRNWVRNEKQQARASPAGYESAKDRSRREASEGLTGRKQHGQRSEFIDINPAGADHVG
jgi:hypothetical protein